MHEMHRSRVRDRFLENGIENMSDRAVLELLLFYCIPRRDTNPIADALLEKFGSLNGVLTSTVDELKSVPGIGDNAAVFLQLLPMLGKRISSSTDGNCSINVNLSDRNGICDYCTSLLRNADNEKFCMLCFDSTGLFINCVTLDSKDKLSVQVNPDYLVDYALINRASSVIFTHNHPFGVASPSRDDIENTAQLIKTFEQFDIRVCDHIIIAPDGLISLAGLEKFSSLFAG